MFGAPRNVAKAYASVGLETGVVAASPHQLITMLFDGALAAILKAKAHMEQQQIAEKGEALSKAIMIIDSGLRAGLNLEQGGELANQLDALYSYMVTRLMEANLQNNILTLREVYQLLTDLKSSWVSIGQSS